MNRREFADAWRRLNGDRDLGIHVIVTPLWMPEGGVAACVWAWDGSLVGISRRLT